MRKPAELAYGLDDRPPLAVVLSMAMQQVTVILVWVFPAILIAREIGLGPAETASLCSLALVACAVGTLVQASTRYGLGSGFLAPASTASTHLVPSLLAAQIGGLPLVAGMTVASGIAGLVLARMLQRLRSLMPPEIAGAMVFIIGVAVSLAGARVLLGQPDEEAPSAQALLVALATLGVAVALGVWGRGLLRWGCVLIAMLAGTLLSLLMGGPPAPAADAAGLLPLLALPLPLHGGFAFELALLPAFLVATLASSLKTVGLVTSLQRLNDADWVRPAPRSIAGGVTGDALATTMAGLLGAPAVNMSPTSVAAQMAGGVTSRVIAFATAGACLALACSPRLAALLSQVPAPAIGAMLLYAGGLMLANGMQLAAARLLDSRRSLSVGLAVAAALTVEALPQVTRLVPAGFGPLMSAVAFGTVVALLLNAVLRIGIRRSVTLTLADPARAAEVQDFATRAGAAWGARREVIARASHLLAAAMDAIAVSGCARGPVVVTLGFDELRLDLAIAYPGPPLSLAETPPSAEDLLEREDALARLAGYMVRRLSDRFRVRHKDGETTLLLHLDH